ncbi:MAG: hypothetical protein Q8O38_01710 [Sulfurimicrobium sp.]|nr:hypothetical protein [Sulfurimicrobium sp.]
MIYNHLALEPLLIERLKSAVPEFRDVIGMADLAAMQESSQVTPAAHVIYQGDTLPSGNSAGQGSTQMVVQTWWVVVAVRSARDTRGGSGAREEAGTLLGGVIQALSGWNPGNGFQPLQRVNTIKPGFNAGFGYFPLAFETRFVTNGVKK